MRRWRDQRGFSLAEVLVSTVFSLWLTLILHEFHHVVSHGVFAQEQRSQAQELARVTLDLMGRELRLAGYSADGAPIVALRRATPDAVEIATDLNGDGDTDDANEVIAYSYDLTKQALMRATSNGTPQPLIDHVPSGAFAIQYRDASGTPLAGDLDAATRARVRTVEIRLGVEFTPDPTRPAVVVTHHNRVHLRNEGP